jgi:hypothetical protein
MRERLVASSERGRRGRVRAIATLFVGTLLSVGVNSCMGFIPSPIGHATVPVDPPDSFVPSTSDAKASRVIDVREGLTKQIAFKLATDVLLIRYSVDVSDPHAGFLMTPWQATLSRNGVPELRYRTRIVIRFLGEEWKEVAIRAEANWQNGDEWDVGYDEAILDQIELDLRNKLGRTEKSRASRGSELQRQ